MEECDMVWVMDSKERTRFMPTLDLRTDQVILVCTLSTPPDPVIDHKGLSTSLTSWNTFIGHAYLLDQILCGFQSNAYYALLTLKEPMYGYLDS